EPLKRVQARKRKLDLHKELCKIGITRTTSGAAGNPGNPAQRQQLDPDPVPPAVFQFPQCEVRQNKSTGAHYEDLLYQDVEKTPTASGRNLQPYSVTTRQWAESVPNNLLRVYLQACKDRVVFWDPGQEEPKDFPVNERGLDVEQLQAGKEPEAVVGTADVYFDRVAEEGAAREGASGQPEEDDFLAALFDTTNRDRSLEEILASSNVQPETGKKLEEHQLVEDTGIVKEEPREEQERTGKEEIKDLEDGRKQDVVAPSSVIVSSDDSESKVPHSGYLDMRAYRELMREGVFESDLVVSAWVQDFEDGRAIRKIAEPHCSRCTLQEAGRGNLVRPFGERKPGSCQEDNSENGREYYLYLDPIPPAHQLCYTAKGAPLCLLEYQREVDRLYFERSLFTRYLSPRTGLTSYNLRPASYIAARGNSCDLRISTVITTRRSNRGSGSNINKDGASNNSPWTSSVEEYENETDFRLNTVEAQYFRLDLEFRGLFLQRTASKMRSSCSFKDVDARRRKVEEHAAAKISSVCSGATKHLSVRELLLQKFDIYSCSSTQESEINTNATTSALSPDPDPTGEDTKSRKKAAGNLFSGNTSGNYSSENFFSPNAKKSSSRASEKNVATFLASRRSPDIVAGVGLDNLPDSGSRGQRNVVPAHLGGINLASRTFWAQGGNGGHEGRSTSALQNVVAFALGDAESDKRRDLLLDSWFEEYEVNYWTALHELVSELAFLKEEEDEGATGAASGSGSFAAYCRAGLQLAAEVDHKTLVSDQRAEERRWLLSRIRAELLDDGWRATQCLNAFVWCFGPRGRRDKTECEQEEELLLTAAAEKTIRDRIENITKQRRCDFGNRDGAYASHGPARQRMLEERLQEYCEFVLLLCKRTNGTSAGAPSGSDAKLRRDLPKFAERTIDFSGCSTDFRCSRTADANLLSNALRSDYLPPIHCVRNSLGCYSSRSKKARLEQSIASRSVLHHDDHSEDIQDLLSSEKLRKCLLDGQTSDQTPHLADLRIIDVCRSVLAGDTYDNPNTSLIRTKANESQIRL
ncbi:unnamed protein product, partial [Amoebophrya sp. A120]